MASKNIEITTAQNVSISYELATVLQRCFAGLIDSVIVWAISFLGLYVFPERILDPVSFLSETIFLIWMYQLFVILFFNGRSLGMRLIKIRILAIGGKNLEFSDYFLRWIMRPLDITLSLCAVGVFSMLSTEKRQRLGDLLAGTAVIKMVPDIHFTLKEILSFHENKLEKEIQFTEIKHIEEKDMLFLKNLLQNNGGYSSEVYMASIDKAAEKFAALLKLEAKPTDNHAFLQQLVNEYVAITR